MALRAQGLALLAVLLAVGLTACDGRTASGKGVPRHVVLISLDTTRADHFGFYGNGRVATPRLDALAAESIVLDDHMTVVPTTLASHVSLLTGKYPHNHGTPRNGFVVNDRNAMLAEVLGEHGFTTAGFAGSFALESRFNFAQGFDHYDESFDRMQGQGGRLQNERTAEAVTTAVRSYLDGVGVPERLFLFVHYFDTHAPYEAPPPYDTMYDPRGREGLPDWKATRRQGLLSKPGASALAARMAAQYAGEMSYMDHHVGELLDDLRERGILDEALVVVTSDHGETFVEHPEPFDHGWTTFQTTMRAVGMIRLPGAEQAGTRVGGVTASIDIAPTLLARLGIDAPEGVDGQAIDLASPKSEKGRVRFGQATKPWEQVETDPRWKNMLKSRCVRDGRYKLVQVPYSGFVGLFDVESDPAEQRNLLDPAHADPSVDVAALRARLGARLESWAESARPLPSRFESALREENIERLKALGYLGDE